tara:strand:+ start:675 stop:971 length:297 start_codon:yes stop_codon:yes gene_type:complete
LCVAARSCIVDAKGVVGFFAWTGAPVVTVDDSPSPSRPLVASSVAATPFATSTMPIDFLSILRRRATALPRLATLGVTSNACAKINSPRRREIERKSD